MQNKWMTREEFEGSNYTGYCWVVEITEDVHLAHYDNNDYYESCDFYASAYDKNYIKAVMPIEKPEYPKEVG